MVYTLKEYKRNAEGEQSFDAEVYYTEQDAVLDMNKKTNELVEDGFTLKISNEHHQYVVDEEQGDEVEYVVSEKIIKGKPQIYSFEDDVRVKANQILPNGWKTEWLDTGFGKPTFTIFKRFVNDNGQPFFVHMNVERMKMVYVIDEARKYNEDRGSFEATPIWEPNEITLLDEYLELPRIHDEAFCQYKTLIKEEGQKEIKEVFTRMRELWNQLMSGE